MFAVAVVVVVCCCCCVMCGHTHNAPLSLANFVVCALHVRQRTDGMCERTYVTLILRRHYGFLVVLK